METQSAAEAGFIRKAGIVWILKVRVGMDGDGEHIIAFIEDILCAVARVLVHVEDRDFSDLGQPLGGDGGVVEEAVSARDLASRVVAWGAAEGKCRKRNTERR